MLKKKSEFPRHPQTTGSWTQTGKVRMRMRARNRGARTRATPMQHQVHPVERQQGRQQRQ